jgi:nicotinate-nucleotide adenylyltransferase
MRRIGIYPGTFDPVHAGHITFAVNTLAKCGLDEIVFIPEHRPRGKDAVTAITHRYAMLASTLQDHTGLKAALLETPRFTVNETLPELKRLFPEAHLTFLIGSDVAGTLANWDDVDTLLPEVSFAIGLRGSDTSSQVTNTLKSLAAGQRVINYTIIPGTTQLTTSSSAIRDGDYSQAPEKVSSYIREYSLY